jgi:hypothetical protein
VQQCIRAGLHHIGIYYEANFDSGNSNFIYIYFSHYFSATLGSLTYNAGTNLITDGSTGIQYLGWNVLADLTYAETVAATAVGGAFESFHIASQTEAYAFYHAMGGLGVDSVGLNLISTQVGTNFSDGIFGNNHNTIFDYAWFISDEHLDVGFINLSHTLNKMTLSDAAMSIAVSDAFSASGYNAHATASWLLVSDVAVSNVSAVPVPAAAFLFAPALLGFLGLRHKRRA